MIAAPRTKELNGRQYVSVTSAMKLVRVILQEPEDYYGPPALAKIHALEGSAAHAACLDWLAYTFHLLPSYDPPNWPEIHGDERRWWNVMHAAQKSFVEFVDQYEVEPIGIEQEALSSKYGLIGHIDLFCFMKRKGRRIKAVVDLKFVSAIMKSHKIQLRCYSKLDGINEANAGYLFHANRNTGLWKLEEVDLNAGLEDVAAVANAARLWEWAKRRK